MLGLDVVHLVVAGDKAHPGLAVAVDKCERLPRCGLGHLEEGREVGDSPATRCLELLEVSLLALDEVDGGRSGLGVCRKATAVTVDNLGLAGIRQCHELDGGVATNLAGVRNHGERTQPHALADARVGALLVVVGLLHALDIGVEGVAVLHDELAAAHEAKAGAQLVAELVLDLIKRHRQLLV